VETKRWFESKLVGIGILQSVIGIAGLLATFFAAGTFSAESFMLLLAGIATVIMRVWFTESTIL